MASASPQRTTLEHLAEPVAAASLARERLLPVVDPLSPLLPDGGLIRGKAVACGGAAAMSLAVSLAVAATAAGSWLAVVNVPSFGLEAAEEFGIALERVVGIEAGPGRANRESWAELVAATFDGFEVVITEVPHRLNAVLARRVQARLGAREAVMITLGSPGPFSTDVELRADDPQWEGIAAGAGYLRGRRVAVSSSGRRIQRSRRLSLWLPGRDGTIAVIDTESGASLAHQHAG